MQLLPCLTLVFLVAFPQLHAAENVPAAKPQIAPGAWRAVLSGEHPRLLGPRDQLRALAQKNADAYKNTVQRQAGETLLAAGIVHAVDGLPPEQIAPHLERMRKIVAQGVTNVHQDTWLSLSTVAQIYDFFHGAIPLAEREQIVAWFNAHLEKFTTNEGAFHNSTTGKIMTYLQIAYATEGENPQAQAFRDYAIIKLYEGKVLPVLLAFGAGGGDTECGWYARTKLWNLTQALELARRVEGYDGFAKAPRFFYGRMAYDLAQAYPGRWTYGTERYPNEGDGSFLYGSHTEYPRQTRTVLAQYFRGSELARAVEAKRRKASNGPTAVSDFFWDEGTQEQPLDLAKLPLAHHAAGIGHVYARSDWSDDATWLRFTCGDFFAPHQHLDVGNFEIFRREPLVTESGEYADYGKPHGVNWLMRSIAHNVVLIHDPSEKWPTMRDGGRTPYANDGGQQWKWEWPADNLPAWEKQRERFERGNIVAYENRPEYLYVAGDCTAAYSPSKLSGWTRQIVFLRPHTVVILDRVQSTQADFAKTWLLHCQNAPEVSGKTSAITNGKGRLTVQTLLPADATLRTVEGYTFGGQNFPAPDDSGERKVAPKWRLEVQPGMARTEDVFLHVLSTSDEPTSPATLLQGEDVVGVKVGDAEVRFDAKLGGSVNIGEKSAALSAKVIAGPFE